MCVMVQMLMLAHDSLSVSPLRANSSVVVSENADIIRDGDAFAQHTKSYAFASILVFKTGSEAVR